MPFNLNPKVGAASLAGAIVFIGVWALGNFGHVSVPPEVSSAATVLVTAIVGWATPSAQGAPTP